MLGNGPYVLGNGPQVLGNGNGLLVCIQNYVSFGVMSFGIISLDIMSHSGLLTVVRHNGAFGIMWHSD